MDDFAITMWFMGSYFFMAYLLFKILDLQEDLKEALNANHCSSEAEKK